DGIRDRNVTGVQTCALPILGAAAICRGGIFPSGRKTVSRSIIHLGKGHIRATGCRTRPRLDPRIAPALTRADTRYQLGFVLWHHVEWREGTHRWCRWHRLRARPVILDLEHGNHSSSTSA